MKKRLLAAIVYGLFAAVSAFSADGVMSGEKDIKVVQTKWFDIIYPKDSEESAALLADNADKIYGEVCSSLGTEQWARFPVVISPSRDDYNAYFTTAYYNHIVLYDTAEPESLAVASDSLLSTFRHELTHAVTYNMKNKFWRTVDAIFGDAVNPGSLILTSSHAEGAAVASESMGGEGRLNDSYSAQMVRQAKIEGLFPGYADIYGAQDKYPGNQNYYFGSAFDSWLQKTYGMEKYAQFWYKCVNFQTIHQSLAFKSVYDISVKDAWNLFKESVEVPDIPADPLVNDGYADYFSGTNMRSPENKRGSRYTSLSAGDTGFAYCDKYGNSLWFSEWKDSIQQYKKPRKVFAVSNATRIQLSADGKYAAVSLTSDGHAVLKNEVRIYGMRSRSWYYIKETGLRDATVVTYNGRQYLAAVKTKSRNTALYIYALKENNAGTRIRGAELIEQIPFPAGTVPFSPADGGDGSVVYVYKNGMNWSIRFYSIADGTSAEYKAPEERMVIRNVSLAGTYNDGKRYTFSWTKPGSMPRFGELLTGSGPDASIKLQSDDVSGGVYNPVMLKTGLVVYSGEFFRDWRLITVDPEKIAADTFIVRNEAEKLAPMVNTINKNTGDAEGAYSVQTGFPQLADAEKYNPFNYYKRGLLLPVSDNSSYAYKDGEFSLMPLPLGITYATSNPWSSGVTELSAGYSPLTNSGALKTYFKSGTETYLFSYALYDHVEFDRYGYKQTMNILQLSSQIPVGNVSYIVFENETDVFEGRQSLTSFTKDMLHDSLNAGVLYNPLASVGMLESGDMTALFVGENHFAAGYTNIHRTGPGTYEQGGFSVSAIYLASYASEAGAEPSWNNFYQNISPEVVIKSPCLLPYYCSNGYTYNFPFKIETSLFTSKSTFLNNTETVVLFAGEVQKAIPFFTLLYISRYRLSAEYTGAFKYAGSSWDFLDTPELMNKLFAGNMDYYDSIGLQAVLTMIPNYGGFANYTTSFNLSAELKYRFHRTEEQNPLDFQIGFVASY